MILSDEALNLINTPAGRRELLNQLKVTEQSIIKYIAANKPNGPLTTFSALQVIKKHTGLSEDQILIAINDTAKV